MYVPAEHIDTRYWSHRTDYGKLRRRVAESKTGGGGDDIKLTPVQEWKVKRWSFIAPYIKKRRQHKATELGKVSICNI